MIQAVAAVIAGPRLSPNCCEYAAAGLRLDDNVAEFGEQCAGVLERLDAIGVDRVVPGGLLRERNAEAAGVRADLVGERARRWRSPVRVSHVGTRRRVEQCRVCHAPSASPRVRPPCRSSRRRTAVRTDFGHGSA